MGKVDGHHEGEADVCPGFPPSHHLPSPSSVSNFFCNFLFSYRASRYSHFLIFPIKVYPQVTWKRILNSYTTLCLEALSSSAASLCPGILAFMVWYGQNEKGGVLVLKWCHVHGKMMCLTSTLCRELRPPAKAVWRHKGRARHQVPWYCLSSATKTGSN